ncbi:surface-adhesin E family protein [Variovorax sp. LG9.2]|uniref:surface-adhesin E family protein n=1 Tax=Variovorax sp. LG9.2 TaxID=3048626 RepID=UPI002B22DD30|nr:surface-adhesin E family protein [Variovorax sp. LG9.2]MEB0057155.1 hypothetical protein [Variovorax sp. LG9.2]
MRVRLAGAAVVVVMAAASAAHAQTPLQIEWFTVAGNPGDPASNTVQVDPVAIGVEGDNRAASKRMNVRVNRSAERVNWDNIPYRSYESQVVFDCQARRAAYVQARYYAQPLWQGEPHTVADYGGNPRPMLFRDMEPNPVNRIVRAACRLKAG